ncbi:MAG TPA: hypothetical protein ENK48_04105 [Gammaproteobacteria bacterium]|nr:hypothetical protein [Gammaproteobacteria bacterium]
MNVQQCVRLGFCHLSRSFLLILTLILPQHAIQAEPLSTAPLVKGNDLGSFTPMKYKFNRSLALKGWQVSDSLYLGSAKIADESGPGLVLDRGSYAYAINHKRVSFIMRF